MPIRTVSKIPSYQEDAGSIDVFRSDLSPLSVIQTMRTAKQLKVLMPTLMLLSACGKNSTDTQTTSTPSSALANPSTYTPRIGYGVRTDSRTCMAIQNGNLTAGAAVTLVFPVAPASVLQGTVGSSAQQPCPLSQNVDTTASNYSVEVKGTVPKLTPFIAIVGTPAVTVNPSNTPQADLEQNGQTESFRACSADNGINLSLWSGAPLTGKLLWHGLYYEPANPAVGPACIPAEVPAS